ncbi:MAG: anthranilate synthase component I family protein [Bacteroidetes bacterium]|nr:anthranilate synthase component I family protein [Bacteroidota bacterium]
MNEVNSNKLRFTINDSKLFKIKMLNWLSRFNIFCLLDNNHYQFAEPGFELLAAAGCQRSIKLEKGSNLDALKTFSKENKNWLFGHFGYDLLNAGITNYNQNPEDINFEDGFFFIPEILVKLASGQVIIESDRRPAEEVFSEIESQPATISKIPFGEINVQASVSRDEYIHRLKQVKEHIHRGDCYEINFCQSFFAEHVNIDAVYFYHKLTSLSPNPFSAFYRINARYCMCASPERFLRKNGNVIISQPIKGTSKRVLSDMLLDEANKQYLKHSPKERSENVMIVDLVRNDLSKVCTEGSVHVSELFAVYSFPQVHQLISTVKGKVDDDVDWTDIIKACFPMGSMTGAPKKKVLELINRYEEIPRGIFSGSIGYVTPGRDFDFNVVIRSLMYDASKQLINFKAGGGITFNSDADKEYEESLLKAEAIMHVLNIS